MQTKNTQAHIAGFIYLVLILTGIFGLVYVPNTLIDWASPATTAANITTQNMMFRWGIMSEIACFICFIALPLCLYELLKDVNQRVAVTMVTLALISIPMTFVNIVNHVNVLMLLQGKEYLRAIPTEQLHAQIMYLLASFNNSVSVSNIFWGAWLFPFGYLVFKSGFLPKTLGIFLMIGCFGYLAEFIGHFLLQLKEIPWYISLPSSLGEFGICLWMLLVGARRSIGTREK